MASYLEEAVNDAHSHVHGFLQQAELEAHLDKPVDEDGPHVASHFPSLKEVRLDILLNL